MTPTELKHAFNNQPYFLQMPLPFHLQTRNGAFGDARLATVEIGRDIVETAIERTLEFIDGFIKG
jgi:creatinine amidohydrolase